MKKGTLSVQAEHIFPIIKQFLYNDREVFLRELVANAVDATQKLKTLINKREAKADGELKVEIEIDRPKRILRVIDYGIGMFPYGV